MTDTATTPTDPAPKVTEVPPPAPEHARLSVNIPFALGQWLDAEADARMVGKALLVTKALEALKDELPPIL